MVVSRSYKTSRPTFAHHVPRLELDRILHAATERSAITWVVGLPGAGKTSLVARWVAEAEAEAATACFWFRLEAHDADVAEFFQALTLEHGAGANLPAWSPEYNADLADFTRSFFVNLTAIKSERLTIVLDDAHRIPDDSALFAMLEAVREVCTESLRFIVVSRRVPPPPLARGEIGGWLSLLANLRLAPTEALAIAESARGQQLSEAEALAVTAADGWLAHVLTLARSGAAPAVPATNPNLRVGDFLAAELLHSVPPDQRVALRHLAELPEIPYQLLSLQLLTAEGKRLLFQLAAQRYFVDDLGAGTFRLHDLLRDALLALNATEDSAEELRQTRLELAQCIMHTFPEAAMDLRVKAGDTLGVLALLEIHGERWAAQGLHQTLVDWTRTLEVPQAPADQASLAFFRGQAWLPLEPEAARPLFTEARQKSLQSRHAERAYAAWCGEVASYVVQWGAVHGLADLVDELEYLEKELGPAPGSLALRTHEGALTALMYGRAEDRRITHYAQATQRAVSHSSDAGARISAAGQLLVYNLWWAGDFPAGRAIYDTFDAEVDLGEHLPPLARLMWWSCASIIDWQCGAREDCYSKVERGLALAASSGVHVRDFFLLTQGIFCALSQEDWVRAEGYLAQLARTERKHKRLDAMVHHFFRSWYSLCRGDARTARAHAETAMPMAEAMGSMFHRVIVLSALAPACVHSGDLEGAEQAYRAQIALAKAANNPTFSFIAFCAGAEIALAKKDDAALKKQVERILLVKGLGGFHSGCGWRTPMMREVLAFALRHNIHPDIARAWIREKRITPPRPTPLGWPMPVHIEASRGLVVTIDGQDTRASDHGKSPQKLRELLAVLVVEPNGATQAALLEWLWPDANADRAAASLKVAIHRLRQWLGVDAVKVHAGRVSLNPDRVSCDVWMPTASEITLAAAEPRRLLEGLDLAPITAVRERLAPRS